MKRKGRVVLLMLCLIPLSCGDTLLIQGDSPGVISTVAGGAVEVAQTGASALEVTIVLPGQVIAGDDGDFYILETGFNRLLYVDSGGKLTRIAGNTTSGFSGDGGDALDALLASPLGFDIDSDGNIYIADTGNHRVRMIDTSGKIRTIAGTDVPGFYGDGLAAEEAGLFKPTDVVAGPKGMIYISDFGNNRIRMIDTDGIIQTICGTGDYSFNGNAIPAVEANLSQPSGLDIDSQGNLYIAVTGYHRVRMIDTSGEIFTLAGSGSPGFGGDGEQAISAQLNEPVDVFVMDDGRGFYIADRRNQRVRFVDDNGMIFTVAGNGESGYNGDGLFATEASLYEPSGISVDIFDNLYIADKDNYRIRRVPFPLAAREGSQGEGPKNPFGPKTR